MFNQACPAPQERAGWWKEEQEARAGNANYAERGCTCSSRRSPPASGLGKGSSPGPGLEQEEKPLPGVSSAAGSWEEARSGSRQRTGMRSSACTALRCNVNSPHPRAPDEALLAPACPQQPGGCPERHAYLQLGQLLLGLAEPWYERPSAQPCSAGRGNAWAALLLL